MTDTETTQKAPPGGPGGPGEAVTPALMARLEATLCLPGDMDAAEKAGRIAAARAMLAGIGPADGIEAMLACQMVAAHEAAMACLDRAAIAGAPPERIDREVRQAERLMALYVRQVDALGRHRARAAQAAPARQQANPEPCEPWRARLVTDAEEWWAARAHVIDPRIVLARSLARGEAHAAGLSEEEREEAVARAAAAVEADLPTIGGKPYILDTDGVRVYPLPDGRRVRAIGITDTPFEGYFEQIRDRDGEAAEAAARGASGHAAPSPPACAAGAASARRRPARAARR